jgi:hypothetical protein
MKKSITFLIAGFFCVACKEESKYTQADIVQLSTPLVNSTSIFATEKNYLEAPYLSSSHQLEITHKESKKKKVFGSQEKITLSQTGTYQIRSIATSYKSSEPIELKVLPQGKKIASVSWDSKSEPKYFKSGDRILNDGKNAEISFHSEGWTGSNEPFRLTLKMEDEIQIDSLLIGTLFNPSVWIYPSASIKLLVQKVNGVSTEKEFEIKVAGEMNEQRHKYVTLNLNETAERIQMEFLPNELPEQHPGAGTPSWIFLDELIIY